MLQPHGFRGWFCAACGKTHERAAQAASTAEDAAARQDPPPRCAVVIAEGVAEALASDQGSRFEAVHAAARHGCCGFVALRALLATDATPDVAAARCVGTLLCPPHADDASLAKRFRGLRAAVLSECAPVRDVASRAGACSLQLPSCTDAGHAQAYASLLSETLGLAVPGAEAQRSSQQAPDSPVDLAVLHLRPRGDAPWSATDADATAACLDGVVSTLRACAAVRQQLYLLLLLGRASSVKAASERDACAAASLPPWLAHLRPHQSYEERLSANEEADEHALLCVHVLDGVVRRDNAAFASDAEFRARGARGTVLLDDVLDELAYKLGRACKFGA